MFGTVTYNQSKEQIAARMVKTAAANWGIDAGALHTLDPVAKMLIEACAVELYRLDNELVNLQKTVSERLAELLIPDVYLEALPANAIMHATSVDASYMALPSDQFLCTKKVTPEGNNTQPVDVDAYLSPAGHYKLCSADVQYLMTTVGLFKINKQSKQQINGGYIRNLQNNPVWIALNVDANETIDISNTALYFAFRNTSERARLLSTLKHSKCFIAGQEVALKQGITYRQNNDATFEQTFDELYINNKIEKEVNESVSNYFLSFPNTSFCSDINANALEFYPKEWNLADIGVDASMFTQKMLWIKIELPAIFNEQVLSELLINNNCFPVLNRQLNTIRYRLSNYFNIIPMLSQSQFLSVHEVMASNEKDAYTYYAFEKQLQDNKGSYTIKNNHVQRFDTRNAKELLDYTIELLREENRAYSAIGQDYLSSSIKAINQNIDSIALKLNQNLDLLNNAPRFLLVNPIEAGDMLTVAFWSTLGEIGNQIKAGTALSLVEGNNYKKDNIILMQATAGGRNKLKNDEVLNAFKSNLLSRGRIVTEADIINFCKAYLNDLAQNIIVSKAIVKSVNPNEGFIPVLEVIITPASSAQTNWENVKIQLKSLLEEKSAVDYNYRIKVN
jgi:hypothetical protein